MEISNIPTEPLLCRFGMIEDPVYTIIGKDGSKDGKCDATGPYGVILTSILFEPWLKKGNNCTIKGYRNFGGFHSKTGLEGGLAKEEIDVSSFQSKMHEIEEVIYGPPAGNDFLAIGSMYNYSDDMRDSDLLSTYLSFHWSYYFSIIAMFLVFTAAWSLCSFLAKRIRKRLKKEIAHARKPSWWIITCAILDQDQYPNISRTSFSLLSLWITLFFYFLINCFMLNMIGTDLVVIPEPKVIRDYQDILDREIGSINVLFLRGTDEGRFFEDAPKGSQEHEVWKRALVMERFDKREYHKGIYDQKYIFIYRYSTSAHVFKLLLELSLFMDNHDRRLRVYLIKDPTEKSWDRGYMIGRHAHPKITEFINWITRRLCESGLLEKPYAHQKLDPNLPEVSNWISSKLDLPDTPENRIELVHLDSLFITISVLITISGLILLIEKLWKFLEIILTSGVTD